MVRLKRADGRAGRYSLFTTLHERVAGGLNYPYGPGVFQPFVMEKTARPASLFFSTGLNTPMIRLGLRRRYRDESNSSNKVSRRET